MRFELSTEAAALQEAAAGLLRAEVTSTVIRAGWPGGDGDLVAAVWRKLAGLGAIGAIVPEGAGGLGLDEVSLVALLEEIGHSGLPVPAAETIAVAAPLLAAAHLDDVLSGRVLVGAHLGAGDLLPFGTSADLIVLRDGQSLSLYERAQLDLEPVVAVDGSRGLARVCARGAAALRLTADPAEIDVTWQRGVLATSALLVGLADRMLELTVEYVKGREQFGVPIGSFQAIKHALASALIGVRFARPMVLAAAWALANGEADASARVSAAKVQASDAARLVARTAIQCHGAMGYTTEYDLHLFAKRAWALALTWGDPSWHRAQLADRLGV